MIEKRYAYMPIMHSRELGRVPMAMLEPHEKQARSNHGQSLQYLASRGGLSAAEALCILMDLPWRNRPIVHDYEKVLIERYESWSRARRADPLHTIDAAQLQALGQHAAPATAEAAQLERLRAIIRTYYAALDNRQHGGIAADRAFAAIQTELGMEWYAGEHKNYIPPAPGHNHGETHDGKN